MCSQNSSEVKSLSFPQESFSICLYASSFNLGFSHVYPLSHLSTPKKGTLLYFFSIYQVWTKRKQKGKIFPLSYTHSCCEIFKEEIRILVEANKMAPSKSYMPCSLKKESLGAKNLAGQAVGKPIPPPPAGTSQSRKPLLSRVPKCNSQLCCLWPKGLLQGTSLVIQWLRPPGFDPW